MDCSTLHPGDKVLVQLSGRRGQAVFLGHVRDVYAANKKQIPDWVCGHPSYEYVVQFFREDFPYGYSKGHSGEGLVREPDRVRYVQADEIVSLAHELHLRKDISLQDII